MSEKPSAPERVRSAFVELSAVASELNFASDELGATISELNDALKVLNLGVSAWIQISGGHDPGDNYWWSRDVGYAKIDNEWGISLRKATGDYSRPDEDDEEKWVFSDAPRWMRVEAINKIPDLLGKLTKEAQDTTKRIKRKNEEARAITATIKASASLKATLTGAKK